MALAVKSIEKWHELGHQLDIDPEKLSEWRNSGKSGAECRDEMITHWEKHNEGASWEKLAQALSRMGENQLAEEVIANHVKKVDASSIILDKQAAVVQPVPSNSECDYMYNDVCLCTMSCIIVLYA